MDNMSPARLYGLFILLSAWSQLTLGAAIQKPQFIIQTGKGAVVQTIDIDVKNPDPSGVELRASNVLKVRFEVVDASGKPLKPDHATLIVSSGAGEKNIASFAAPTQSGDYMECKFMWDTWQNQYGPILAGTKFDLSVAVGSLAPHISVETKLGSILFAGAHGKSSASTGSRDSIASQRISKIAASSALKREIIHQQRPEVQMVTPIISTACALVVALPSLLGFSYIIKQGANVEDLSTGSAQKKALSALFHGGIAAVLVLQLAFWTRFTLLQILPALVTVEICTLLVGIKCSALMSSCPTQSAKAASTLSEATSQSQKKAL